MMVYVLFICWVFFWGGGYTHTDTHTDTHTHSHIHTHTPTPLPPLQKCRVEGDAVTYP